MLRVSYLLMNFYPFQNLQWIHFLRWGFLILLLMNYWQTRFKSSITIILALVFDSWRCFLQRLLKMVDGLNFKDFVAFLSVFSAKANMIQKIECKFINPLPTVYKIVGIFSLTLISSSTICIFQLSLKCMILIAMEKLPWMTW